MSKIYSNRPFKVGTFVRFRTDGDIGRLNSLERPSKEQGKTYTVCETIQEVYDGRSIVNKSLLSNGNAYHPLLLKEVAPPDDEVKKIIKTCPKCGKDYIGLEDICAMCEISGRLMGGNK